MTLRRITFSSSPSMSLRLDMVERQRRKHQRHIVLLPACSALHAACSPSGAENLDATTTVAVAQDGCELGAGSERETRRANSFRVYRVRAVEIMCVRAGWWDSRWQQECQQATTGGDGMGLGRQVDGYPKGMQCNAMDWTGTEWKSWMGCATMKRGGGDSGIGGVYCT